MNRYFSWHGRMNRMRYILAKFTISFLIFAVLGIVNYAPLNSAGISTPVLEIRSIIVGLIVAVVLFFLFYLNICFILQRLHDHGRSDITFFWLFVPVVNIYWHILLLFCRGEEGPNAYGPDPVTHGYGHFNELV